MRCVRTPIYQTELSGKVLELTIQATQENGLNVLKNSCYTLSLTNANVRISVVTSDLAAMIQSGL